MVWLDQIGDFFLSKEITANRLDGSTFSITPMYEGTENREGDEPHIVFFDYDIILDPNRLGSIVRKEAYGDQDTVTYSGTPEPHAVYYQVEVISYWKEDDIALRHAWMKEFPMRGGIDVPAMDGNGTVRVFYEQVGFKNMDESDRSFRSGRMYRKVYRYVIWAELDLEQLETYYRVKEVGPIIRIGIAQEEE